MTAEILDHPMSPDSSHSLRGLRQPQSEEGMYVAITRNWFRMLSHEERRKHPLRPYVLGRDFARSLSDVPIDRLLVASVCARLACRHMWERDGGESMPLEHEPRDALDPAMAWWLALERPNGFGVHYAELGGGIIEFLSVAHRNEQPTPSGSR